MLAVLAATERDDNLGAASTPSISCLSASSPPSGTGPSPPCRTSLVWQSGVHLARSRVGALCIALCLVRLLIAAILSRPRGGGRASSSSVPTGDTSSHPHSSVRPSGLLTPRCCLG